MYKCVDCGTVFYHPTTWEEDRGEFWGSRCSEIMSGCPYCKGDYEEAFECDECGEWFFDDELDDGLCADCIDDKQ